MARQEKKKKIYYQRRRQWFDPWPRKIARATEPVRPWASAAEPALQSREPQLQMPARLQPVLCAARRPSHAKPTRCS